MGHKPMILPEAVYFGTDNRLFGQLHRPEFPTRRPVVVVCAPLGFEQIRTFRTTKMLAERLSDVGFHVLRFDYETTGDSAGLETDSNRLELLLDSIRDAIHFASEATGISGTALVGLRLGANLAARVAEECKVKQLVLWAPCDSGSIYVREQQIMAAAQKKRTASVNSESSNDTGADAGGYYLTEETQVELNSLKFSEQPFKGDPDVLLMNRDDIKVAPRLANQLQSNSSNVESIHSAGYQQMMLPPQLSTTPTETIDALCDWLNDKNAQHAAGETPGSVGCCSSSSVIEPGVRESAVRFGPEQNLFGIITQPESSATSAKTGVLFLCGGSTHRISANRMYVTMARRLAQAGTPSMRIDLSGIGDSQPRPGQAQNQPYSALIADDVDAAMDSATKVSGVGRFVLFGLCSGAYAAMQTAKRSKRVCDIILVNQLVYYISDRQFDELASGVIRSGHDLDYPRSDNLLYKTAVKMLRRIPARWNWPGQWLSQFILGGSLAADIDALMARDIRLAFLQSSRDDSVDALAISAGRKVQQLELTGQVRLKCFDATDHTFSPTNSQTQLSDWLCDYAVGLDEASPQ